MDTTMTVPNQMQAPEGVTENQTQTISREDMLRELEALREKIQVMEWDRARKQLNASKAVKLTELLQRKKDLAERLNTI